MLITVQQYIRAIFRWTRNSLSFKDTLYIVKHYTIYSLPDSWNSNNREGRKADG